MSEKYTDSLRELEQLDAAIADPFIERVLQKVRDYNELIKGVKLTDEERFSIQNELDMEWGSLYGGAFNLSGNIYAKLEGDDEEPTVHYLEDVTVMSKGFVVTKSDIELGGEVIENYRVAHYLMVDVAETFPQLVEKFAENNEPVPSHMHVIADIDQVVMQSQQMSHERAEAWLSLSVPDLMEEVESRLLADHAGEDEALLSLRGLNPNEFADLSDDFTRECFDIYINKVFAFDAEVPYTVSLDGPVRIVDSEGGSVLADARVDTGIVAIHGVFLQPPFTAESSGNGVEWSIGVNMSIYPLTKESEATYVVASIDSLTDVKSIRRVMYSES